MANIDAGLVRGPQGPQGIKGDPFTYADFTESQIAELKRPATEAAVLADKAAEDAQAAIAEVKATEAKLYPAAENILKGKVKETFVHVDDAFPSTLLGIEIEGATEQVTTAGKNLVDAYNKDNERGYLNVDGSLEDDGSDEYHVSDYVTIEPSTTYFITMSRTTHTSAPAVCEYDSGKAFVAGHNNLGKGAAFTTASNAAFVRVSCKVDEPGVVQLEKGSIQTAYEPYSGGKPSPSPDYPQEIKVIENPTLKVTGRNLLDASLLIMGYSVDTSDGHVYSTSTNNWYANVDFMDAHPIAGKQVVASGLLSGKQTNFLFYDSNEKYISCSGYSKETFVFNVPENAELMRVDMHTDVYSQGTASLELAPASGSYKPYTSQSLAFTLPQEHPYLAKLPDGTADEIVVDKDGNVELVARVSKVIPKDSDRLNYGSGTDTDAAFVTIPIDRILHNIDILCNSYKTINWSNKSGYIYIRDVSDIVIRDDRFTSKEKAIELLNGVIVYVAVEPTRYQLGKIEMPKAQDSISNVWTDAEVMPRTGIEYTRDVNIVVANLESAIASIS